MRKIFDDKTRKLIIMVCFLIVFALIAYRIINNVESIFFYIANVFSIFIKILMPFVIGLFIAFLLYPAASMLENEFIETFNMKDKRKLARGIATTLVYTIALSIISLIITYLVPTIKQSVMEFSNNWTSNVDNVQSLLNKYNINLDVDYEKEILSYISKFVQTEGNVMGILTGVMNFTTAFLNLVLGIIISFYILVDRESLGEISKKFIYALCSKRNAHKTLEFCSYTNKIFNKFIIGKIIDSIIIGLLAYIGLFILNIRYRLIFSIIIGITNVIPYFGPFMGGIPVVILVFLCQPTLAVAVGIFIFLLQQFDGSILGPKILGDAIGVKPISVILAIIIGGALAGVLGMFLAVPTFVIISDVVMKYIEVRYRKNTIKREVIGGED